LATTALTPEDPNRRAATSAANVKKNCDLAVAMSTAHFDKPTKKKFVIRTMMIVVKVRSVLVFVVMLSGMMTVVVVSARASSSFEILAAGFFNG